MILILFSEFTLLILFDSITLLISRFFLELFFTKLNLFLIFIISSLTLVLILLLIILFELISSVLFINCSFFWFGLEYLICSLFFFIFSFIILLDFSFILGLVEICNNNSSFLSLIIFSLFDFNLSWNILSLFKNWPKDDLSSTILLLILSLEKGLFFKMNSETILSPSLNFSLFNFKFCCFNWFLLLIWINLSIELLIASSIISLENFVKLFLYLMLIKFLLLLELLLRKIFLLFCALSLLIIFISLFDLSFFIFKFIMI